MIKRMLAAVPGVAAALLPNATCPACWPVYAGILSAVGLGFLITGPYFLVMISALLVISLFSLYYKAKTRRGYKPLFLGLAGAAIILTGKIMSADNYILYFGAGILIAGSIWNNVLGKRLSLKDEPNAVSCPNCFVDNKTIH